MVESSEALTLPAGQRRRPLYFRVLGSCGSLSSVTFIMGLLSDNAENLKKKCEIFHSLRIPYRT